MYQPGNWQRVPFQLNKKENFEKSVLACKRFYGSYLLYGFNSNGPMQAGSAERMRLGVNSISLRVQMMSESIVDCTQ
jgi:hypothetical protein